MNPRKTDYSKIADRYDKNRIRHTIPKDERIETYYARNYQRLKILDLACGTGIYLQKQIECYRDYDIRWFGVNLSPEMLQKAKDKKLKAELLLGDALDMPFDQNFFDYVVFKCLP